MYDDFSLADGTQLNGLFGGNLNQDAIHKSLGGEWLEDHSLFEVVPSSEITEAGTALCFDRSIDYTLY